MKASLQEDKHTDYELNWIDKAISDTADCIAAGYSDQDLIDFLRKIKVPDFMHFLLIRAAEILRQNENYENTV